MMDTIFIETSAFVALNNPKDTHHNDAVAFIKTLLGQTVKFKTSFVVIQQVATKLKEEAGFEKAARFLNFFDKEGIQILSDEKAIWEKAQGLFLQSETMDTVDFFDCHCAAMMQYYGILTIFSFESHFDKLGVVRMPKRIS